MSKRGPKPKPTALKVLLGNPGKRALPKNEPKPRAGIPECPDYLSPVAREQWFRWVHELHAMRVLTTADRESLARACETHARWLAASEQLQKTGMLIKAPSGYPIINPLFSVLNKLAEQMRAFEGEFGLTPAARTRISANVPTEDEENAKDPIQSATDLLGG